MVSPTRLAACLMLLVLLLAPGAVAAVPPTPETFAKVDAWVEASMEAGRIPGAAVALVKDGIIVHARGYGSADPSGRPVTPETPFFVMSVTKPFTALLVLQLVEEGKIALDTPYFHYVPWFEVADPRGAEITIRHLLTHTSGLPTITPGEYDRILASPQRDDLEQEVGRLREVPLASRPGERFQYSNAGYTMLAHLLESLEGRAYEDLLAARLFEPLGMAHAHARPSEAKADGLAMGHRSWFGRPVPYAWDHSRIGLGSGFTYASADDLARFVALHLGEGGWNGTRLLLAHNVATSHEPVVAVPSPDGARHYGLGWFVERHHGQRLVHHAGAGPNFHAHVLLLPDDEWGVVVVANKNDGVDPGPIEAIGPGIASILLGEDPPAHASRGGLLPSIRTFLLVVDPLLLGAVAWGALRLRRPARRRRAGLPIALALLGAGWALLSLRVVPQAFWPLRGLWLTVPDLALLLTLGGIAGALGAAVASLHAVRSWRAGARG